MNLRLLIVFLALSAPILRADDHAPAPTGPTPDAVIKQLREGNARYVADERKLPRQSEDRRVDTYANGQHPIAAVLSCADSRVPVEFVFDQGIGDLFTIRVAGNVANTDEIGTIEYGVEHLKIPVIVVLGHTKCGAVTAVVDHAHVEGHLAKLVAPIAPAAEKARENNPNLTGKKLVLAAIKQNVRQAMSDLTTKSPVLAKAVESGQVKIVGGVYDLLSGNINWLDADASEPTTPAVSDAKPKATKSLLTDTHDDHAPAPKKSAPADDHDTPKKPAKASAHHDEDDKPAKSSKVAAKQEDDHAPAKHESPKAKKSEAKSSAHSEEDAHSRKSDSHDADEEHDDAESHASATKKTDKPHNWYILSGFFGASTLTSLALVHLLYRGK